MYTIRTSVIARSKADYLFCIRIHTYTAEIVKTVSLSCNKKEQEGVDSYRNETQRYVYCCDKQS